MPLPYLQLPMGYWIKVLFTIMISRHTATKKKEVKIVGLFRVGLVYEPGDTELACAKL
jgi:hypothetical protein